MPDISSWPRRRHAPRPGADEIQARERVRAALQVNRAEVRATLDAGGGRLWCCLGGLAVYPQACPFGHSGPRLPAAS